MKDVTTYQEGFEDSLELRYLLGLVKEHKFDRLGEMIGAQK